MPWTVDHAAALEIIFCDRDTGIMVARVIGPDFQRLPATEDNKQRIREAVWPWLAHVIIRAWPRPLTMRIRWKRISVAKRYQVCEES